MAKATNILYNPEAYAKEHCFDLQNMTDLECTNFLSKLFSELSCVRRVLTRTNSEIIDLKCDCPTPCRSMEYSLTIGTSSWPSPGPELDAAYTSIVRGIVIPNFRRKQTPLLNRTIHYFENESNKNEIIANFARVTIYIRSLKVERSEQVAAYTILDLMSDVGKTICRFIPVTDLKGRGNPQHVKKDFYPPPTTLREGNVFHLSKLVGPSCDHYPLDLGSQGQTISHLDMGPQALALPWT